jgi:hypothetical protein
MKRIGFVPAIIFASLLQGCIHSFSMHSMDGEVLSGKYRFGQEGKGVLRVVGTDGEVLAGNFLQVGSKAFVESYRETFGGGSIVVVGPDASAYGNAFGGAFAGAYAPTGSVHGETFNKASGESKIVVAGPRFYWTASLKGNRGTTMACYFIGSSYTGGGFGRCKSGVGKEYSLEF